MGSIWSDLHRLAMSLSLLGGEERYKPGRLEICPREIEAEVGRIAASGQLGAWEHNCLAAEHCYTKALPEEVELEAEVSEPEFVVVAVGLERGLHLPEV